MRWIFLWILSAYSNFIFCQSRKSQIEDLIRSLDSINGVLTFERLQHLSLYDSYELNSDILYGEQERLLYSMDTFRSRNGSLSKSLMDSRLSVQSLSAELNSALGTNDSLLECFNTLKYRNNLLDEIESNPFGFTSESFSESTKLFITRSMPSYFAESGEPISLGKFSLHLFRGSSIISDHLGGGYSVMDGFSILDKSGNSVLATVFSTDYLYRYSYFVGNKGDFLLVLKEYSRNDINEFGNNANYSVQFIYGTSLIETDSDYFMRKSVCFNMNIGSYQIINPGYVLLLYPHDIFEDYAESIRWKVCVYDPYYDCKIDLGVTKGFYKPDDIRNNLFYNRLKSSVEDVRLYNSILDYIKHGKILNH